MEAALKTEVAILVVLEMCMSLLGIVCNLLIVATVRQDETLRATTLNFLLFNLCFSNLLIAFFVKPISAIYTGYAMSTDQWQVRNIIDIVLNDIYLMNRDFNQRFPESRIAVFYFLGWSCFLYSLHIYLSNYMVCLPFHLDCNVLVQIIGSM